eukprot:ANDGO_02228.mRNA.1 Hypothetical protein GL50803_15432
MSARRSGSSSHRSVGSTNDFGMDDYDNRILTDLIQESESHENELTNKLGGADAFSAVHAFHRNVSRSEKKIEKMRVLTDIERRASAHGSQPPSDRSHYHQQQAMMKSASTALSRRDLIEESKQRARGNMLQYVQSMTVEEVKIGSQKEKEEIIRKFELEIAELRHQRDEAVRQATDGFEAVSALQEEIGSLKYTTDLLRKKVQKMGEREVENQRKLAAFQHLEPIFDKLSDEFQFSSPEQILKKIEKLKEAQVELYSQYSEAVESKGEMEKKMDRIKRDTEGRLQKQLNEAFDARTRAERKLNEAESRINELQSQVRKLSDMRETYLTVNSSIMDLWNKWSGEATSKLGNSAGIEDPDMSNPLMIIVSLHNLLIEFTPSRAGESFRELSGIANRYWMRYFSDDFELKGHSKQILERLAAMADEKAAEVEKCHKHIAALQEDSKLFMDKIHRLEVEKRQLIAELDSAKPHRAGSMAGSRPGTSNTMSRPVSRSSTISAGRHRPRPPSVKSGGATVGFPSGDESPTHVKGHSTQAKTLTQENARSFFLTQAMRE